MKVRRMLSGFWGVSSHGKLRSAFQKHSDALAYAVTLPDHDARIGVALAKLADYREAVR